MQTGEQVAYEWLDRCGSKASVVARLKVDRSRTTLFVLLNPTLLFGDLLKNR